MKFLPLSLSLYLQALCIRIMGTQALRSRIQALCSRMQALCSRKAPHEAECKACAAQCKPCGNRMETLCCRMQALRSRIERTQALRSRIRPGPKHWGPRTGPKRPFKKHAWYLYLLRRHSNRLHVLFTSKSTFRYAPEQQLQQNAKVAADGNCWRSPAIAPIMAKDCYATRAHTQSEPGEHGACAQEEGGCRSELSTHFWRVRANFCDGYDT